MVLYLINIVTYIVLSGVKKEVGGLNLKRWYKEHTVSTPIGDPDRYNQHEFTTDTIQGRLVETEEEVTVGLGDTVRDEMVIAKAKLFTETLLDMNTKIGDYKIISKKACYNRNNVLEFYKYYLK